MGQWPILPIRLQGKGPHRTGEGLLAGGNRHNALGGGYNASRRFLPSVILVWRAFVAGLGRWSGGNRVFVRQATGNTDLGQGKADRAHLICNTNAIIL